MSKFNHMQMKRLAIFGAAGVMFSLVVGWLHHWHQLSYLVGVIGFTAAGMLTSYLIDKRRLPGVVLQTLDRMQRRAPKDLVRGLLRLVGKNPALVFGLPTVLIWSQSVPAE